MNYFSNKNKLVLLSVLLCAIFYFGYLSIYDNGSVIHFLTADDLSLDEEEATVRAIGAVSPAVVSIIVYETESLLTVDTATGERSMENERIERGRGSGFIISTDGYILTNKHVVESAASGEGDFRIILNSGRQYYAQLIGKDPLNDLAVLKIFDKNLPFVSLGDSDSLQVGNSVIAIGNVLGKYQNSATKGIVSGLGRSILTSDSPAGERDTLDNVIQTDAEINPGNSGGPLLNLRGGVIGVNVAIDEGGASIGFAIPINDARPVINSIIREGRIVRPRLGLSYIMLNPELAADNKLNRDTGAWIKTEVGEKAIVVGGPADKAGIMDGDIIFEINAIKLAANNTLLSQVQKYKPGDRIGLRILRGETILILEAELDEFK